MLAVLPSHGSSEHQQPLATMSDEPLRIPRPERPSSPEQEHRLEQRSLPRTITPPNQIAPRAERHLGVLDASKAIYRELGENHRSRMRRTNRCEAAQGHRVPWVIRFRACATIRMPRTAFLSVAPNGPGLGPS